MNIMKYFSTPLENGILYQGTTFLQLSIFRIKPQNLDLNIY